MGKYVILVIRNNVFSLQKAPMSIWIISMGRSNGIPYCAGALGNPVPIEKPFAFGCDRVVLILTRPEHALRTSKQDERFAARIRKRYPLAAEKLCERAQRYSDLLSALGLGAWV